MGMRVTSQAAQQSALNNIFRVSEDLFNTQNALSSGKKLRRASEDPSVARQTLTIKASIGQNNQYLRNINNNIGFVSSSETALESASLNLVRTKELVVSEIGSKSTATTRMYAAEEVRGIIREVTFAANSKFGNRYLFAGDKVDSSPFSVSASGAVYQGNTGAVSLAINENTSLQMNLPGSDTFSVDLNPTTTASTNLSDLNGGLGVTNGSFLLADRQGNSATIEVSNSGTLGDVITKINNASLNITASINDSKNGIRLTDTSSQINQSLSITEVNGSTTAKSLGLIGERNGVIQGFDLNPKLNRNVALSQLKGGQGISLTEIGIINGSASGTVSFSSLNSSSTIGDVLDLMNNSSFNIAADIASDGKGLRVVSNSSTTIAIVNEIGSGNSAEILGLGGGQNIITTLLQTQQALEKNDSSALVALIDNLDKAVNSISGSRANLGTITRRLDNNEFALEKRLFDKTERLSNIEDTDFVSAASDLAALELAYQSTLNATSRIIQPSILNFLR